MKEKLKVYLERIENYEQMLELMRADSIFTLCTFNEKEIREILNAFQVLLSALKKCKISLENGLEG